jgi:hypothetical protein
LRQHAVTCALPLWDEAASGMTGEGQAVIFQLLLLA